MGILEERKLDISTKLLNVTNEFSEFVNIEFSNFSTYFGEQLQEGVYDLLNGDKPKVMVYGIYNSGKSTLINSLCKEEVAETADRPMTDQIAEYDKGDYYLVDSPGVDAPIQHEIVTEEHINKCHVILFVISSKGMFEDRTNYMKLVNLIKKDIPFVIVLNDRGCPISKDWTDEEKKKAKFEHDQELKIIQYKIIENLIRESNDKNIADKYEVIILNAKKAWMGVEKNKPQLYENSGVNFLEKRISQLLTSESAIGAMYKQPISNLKGCLNELEKMITQTLSGNSSEDFGLRLHTLEMKKDNILDDLRILIQQTVKNYLDELTNSYMNDDSDIFETIANSIYMDIDDKYSAKLNELLVFVDHNFKNLNLYMDGMSNLAYESTGKKGSVLTINTDEAKEYENMQLPEEKKRWFDHFKTRKKREKEKQERLEQEATIRNERAQYKLQENIRRKQEARQLASSDLDVLMREFNTVVGQGLSEKYDEIISQIQQIDCLNKQAREDGERQMERVREFRKEILVIENSIN
ncbi:GTPase [Agathobacter sp.]